MDAGSKLAKGAAASLSRDAADAYAEVLHFSLQQVGRSDPLAQLPRETVVEALAKELPGFDPETQRELSNARSIWTQTLLGWASSAQADRIEFVTEVLDLAGFGTPGLGGDQAFSTSGGGAGSGDSASSLYLQNLAGAPYEGSDCWGALVAFRGKVFEADAVVEFELIFDELERHPDPDVGTTGNHPRTRPGPQRRGAAARDRSAEARSAGGSARVPLRLLEPARLLVCRGAPRATARPGVPAGRASARRCGDRPRGLHGAHRRDLRIARKREFPFADSWILYRPVGDYDALVYYVPGTGKLTRVLFVRRQPHG